MTKVVIPTENGFASVYTYDKKGNLISHETVKESKIKK